MSGGAVVLRRPPEGDIKITEMIPSPATTKTAAAGPLAAWLIGTGVVLNVLLFVTVSALALSHAARNSLAMHFAIVAVTMVCTIVAAAKLLVVLRRRHSRHSLPGPRERIIRHERMP